MTHLAYIDTETTGLDIDKHDIWELALIIENHPYNPHFNGEWLFQFPVSLDAADPVALKMTDFINRYECWDGQPKLISKPEAVVTNKEASKVLSVWREQRYSGAITNEDRHDKENEYYQSITLTNDTFSVPVALQLVVNLTAGAHLVGAVPDFDAYRLDRLIKKNPTVTMYDKSKAAKPQKGLWHYHLIDIENLAVGYIKGQDQAWRAYEIIEDDDLRDVTLPWKSDELSHLVGVEPPTEDERHTALGDARWAKRVYERIML